MSVKIRLFGETTEVIEAGYADKIHDLMMAVLVVDFTEITTGLNFPLPMSTLNEFTASLEEWVAKKEKHPIYLQESDVYIVALEEDEVVGVACINRDTDIACNGFRLSNIFVIPSARRRGIASMIIDSAIKCGQDNNVPFMSLNVAYTNEAAQALYAKYGFAPARVNMIRQMEVKAETNDD